VELLILYACVQFYTPQASDYRLISKTAKVCTKNLLLSTEYLMNLLVKQKIRTRKIWQSEWKSGRLPKINPNFNVSFPTTACSPTFYKTNVLHNDLKKDAIDEFGIKYWTSNPVWVKFQKHGSSFYVNIEEKVWLLVEKNTTWKDWLKLRFLTEIGRFHWNQGEEVAHFAWFGELDVSHCMVFKIRVGR
jgi:hypothetical protein